MSPGRFRKLNTKPKLIHLETVGGPLAKLHVSKHNINKGNASISIFFFK